MDILEDKEEEEMLCSLFMKTPQTSEEEHLSQRDQVCQRLPREDKAGDFCFYVKLFLMLLFAL